MNIGIVGAGGYIGSAIHKSLAYYGVTPIYKNTKVDTKFDIIVHAANPAKRFYANTNIEEDYNNTVNNTKKILDTYSCKTILISSISCRTQLDTPYGDHRKMCEELVLNRGGTVFRLGPLFGGNRKEDIIHDIVNGNKIYYSEDTKYAYVDVDWAADYVVNAIQRITGVYEIGASNTVTLKEIADAVESKSIFEGPNDDQYPLKFKNGPDARKAIDFARSLI